MYRRSFRQSLNLVFFPYLEYLYSYILQLAKSRSIEL